MFYSGFRVSETLGNNISNPSDLENEEESMSLTDHDDHQESSGSDLLNQIDDINDFMFHKRERRSSLTV
jgi:hypothetical protein